MIFVTRDLYLINMFLLQKMFAYFLDIISLISLRETLTPRCISQCKLSNIREDNIISFYIVWIHFYYKPNFSSLYPVPCFTSVLKFIREGIVNFSLP